MLDKEWVHLSRADPGYEIGAWNFVHSVGVSSGDADMVVCPCTDCRNMDRHLGCDVVDHLVRRGMDESYKQQIDWYHHGDVVSQCEVEKACVMKQMGCIRRSAKSRMVDKIRQAKNNTEKMQLRPKNVPIAEWRKFIKVNSSQEFKVISDKFKERRSVQIPHTCSRKGMARLAEDLKKECSDPSEVTRFKVWVKSRTKKDGTKVNTNAAQKISVNTRKQPKCDLYDYCGGDEKVAEGRILSSDPEDFVNDIPLGPNSVKVLVQTAIKPYAFLWRPAANLFSIEEAVGEIIAWPQRFAVLHDQGSETEDNDPKSSNTNPTNVGMARR